MKKFLPWILILPVFIAFTPQGQKYFSVTLDQNFYTKGKVMKVRGRLYYDLNTGKMVTHYTEPFEYYYLANNKGEIQLYYPAKNEVLLTGGLAYRTDRTLIYYFLSHKTRDLGLADLGFRMQKSEYKEGHLITSWINPEIQNEGIARVETVHKNFLPIYLGYYNARNRLVQKVYYYGYTKVGGLDFPAKVVEITYLPDGDSTINRTVYSDFSINEDDESRTFIQFKVPSDARVIEK